MKEIEIVKIGNVSGKQVLQNVKLEKEDNIKVITTRCNKTKQYAILQPNDSIQFNSCHWYKRISCKGTWLWTGMRFIKI